MSDHYRKISSLFFMLCTVHIRIERGKDTSGICLRDPYVQILVGRHCRLVPQPGPSKDLSKRIGAEGAGLGTGASGAPMGPILDFEAGPIDVCLRGEDRSEPARP